MEIPLLKDILVIFCLSILVILLCHRYKVPPLVGFILTGVLCGPNALGIVHQLADVETLSEIGIILLLFTVGLEFSIEKIIEYKRYFFIGGAIQVGLTLLGGFLIANVFGKSFAESFFFGCLISLSSTAIVLKVLQDRLETLTPHGRAIVGILIFQDVIAIPMMLLIPFLNGDKFELSLGLGLKIVMGLILMVLIFVVATSLLPRLFDLITRTRSRELFLMTTLTLCFLTAWLTSLAGLSLSIGAFLAGLILSDSEYSLEAIGDILPFKDIFTSFFFVSIGMLSDFGFILQNPLLILSITAAIILLKILTGTMSVVFVGMPLRSALLTGFAIAQVGEFSFVMAKAGADAELLDALNYQLFIDLSVLSMAAAPFLIRGSDAVSRLVLKLPLPSIMKTGYAPFGENKGQALKDHIIIAGYGIAGQNIAQSLKSTGIPYIILEMNSEVVKKEKKKGESIFFGDGTHPNVLQHLGIHDAKALVVVISDQTAAYRVVQVAKQMSPDLTIIARTRRVQEMDLMYNKGAKIVVPDEFGTSIEILSRCLRLFHISSDEIEQVINEIRSENYQLHDNINGQDLSRTVKMESFKVDKGSPLVNMTVFSSSIKKLTGVTVIAIRRGQELIEEINPETLILAEDWISVIGKRENITKAKNFIKERQE